MIFGVVLEEKNPILLLNYMRFTYFVRENTPSSGWLVQAMVLGKDQGRVILLIWIEVGQWPAGLATGGVWVYTYFILDFIYLFPQGHCSMYTEMLTQEGS